MALGPRLDLRQSQSLVMTPQLQQAIRLLALSNLEIEGFIAEEMEKNPLLDSGGSDDDPNLESPPVGETEMAGDGADSPDIVDLVASGDVQQDAPLDVDYDSEDFHQDSEADSMRGAPEGLGLDGGLGLDRAGPGGGEDVDYDSFAAGDISLQDHLLAQAGASLSDTDLLIATQIIEQLEETGYFCESLSELAGRLGAPLGEVEHVLAVVQTFDPAGIAARSLAECLAIQAKEAGRYDPAMARLIDNLDYLAKGNLGALKRICGVDDEDLRDMIRELRALDPKPGCRFGSGDRIDGIVPDVFVARRSHGWAIELNGATLPRLLVNRTYYTELAGGAQDRKSKAWLAECLASANWLLKALDQRARTIIKVSTEIVKQQDAFFRQGVAHLRPLTLRAVADAIGMHESTVSRVTSNKYLACDRGLFELKYFFTSGIQSSDGGDAVSAEAVKSHIKSLIGAEDPKAILSDDQLVDLLRAKGFDIARRTVAKYREVIGIGSSVQRRRQKAIGSHAT
ncbi:MAG: RNA polymerase factor sigma-54 [Sphingosinicella sp.]|nr:RNA polymerase factor sigma-54 [Sphingosinicella sp.]